MRLISRHILRTLATPFVWGVAALTGMLLLQALPPLIEQFGGKGLSAGVMVEGVLLFLPALLVQTLPMAVLVSTLYGYSQLAAALELVAMYANGISVWRMARPALIGAAVVAVINFLIIDQVLPKSNIRFNDLRRAAMAKSPTLALRQQVLNVLPAPAGYILRADQIDPVTGKMKKITIFDLTGAEGRRLIIADSGLMAESGDDLILTLHSGQILEFKRDEPGHLQETNFIHDRVMVRGVQNEFERTSGHNNPGEREKSSCELRDGVDDQRWFANYYRQLSEYQTRRDLRIFVGLPPLLQPSIQQKPKFAPHCGVYRRFGNWVRKLMLPQPLAAQQPPVQQPAQQPPAQQPPAQQPPVKPAPVTQQPPARQPSTQHPDSQHPDSQQKQPATLPLQPQQTPLAQPPVYAAPGPQQFLVPPSQTPAIIVRDGYNQALFNELSVNDALITMRKYQVEYYQKFALPLASFCFVLLGMALALKYPGSGIGLVIGGSLVIFLLFYIMLQGGKNVAIAGHLDPAIALYSPLVLFTVAGLIAVNSADREMGTARSAGIFASIADFFRHFGR